MEEIGPFLLRHIGTNLKVFGVLELHLGANGKRASLRCHSALDGSVLFFSFILFLREDNASRKDQRQRERKPLSPGAPAANWD